MLLGPLGEGDRPLDRLQHEIMREVAREAEVHGAVDQSLHHQEHVGWAGAADRGRHRDEALVADLKLVTQRAQ